MKTDRSQKARTGKFPVRVEENCTNSTLFHEGILHNYVIYLIQTVDLPHWNDPNVRSTEGISAANLEQQIILAWRKYVFAGKEAGAGNARSHGTVCF